MYYQPSFINLIETEQQNLVGFSVADLTEFRFWIEEEMLTSDVFRNLRALRIACLRAISDLEVI